MRFAYVSLDDFMTVRFSPFVRDVSHEIVFAPASSPILANINVPMFALASPGIFANTSVRTCLLSDIRKYQCSCLHPFGYSQLSVFALALFQRFADTSPDICRD